MEDHGYKRGDWVKVIKYSDDCTSDTEYDKKHFRIGGFYEVDEYDADASGVEVYSTISGEVAWLHNDQIILVKEPVKSAETKSIVTSLPAEKKEWNHLTVAELKEIIDKYEDISFPTLAWEVEYTLKAKNS